MILRLIFVGLLKEICEKGATSVYLRVLQHLFSVASNPSTNFLVTIFQVDGVLFHEIRNEV